MSSKTKVDMNSVRGVVQGLGDEMGSSGPTMELTERQKTLDMLYRYFRCSNYDGRKTDWDGTAASTNKIEHDYVATSGNVPNGFYDAGQTNDIPIKFRKPSAPFYLARVIVKRFTSLLFSQRRHPRPNCDDPVTEDWLVGFAEATRLWAQMSIARNYGGAMGSVGLGFKIIDSKPLVEVHDPRWCHVKFSDREELVVSEFEKRYQFPEEVYDPITGDRIQMWFWYRRVINDATDTVWPKVAVQDDEEPIWENFQSEEVTHNFGFCPIVWVQNMPVADAVDGDPDCLGIFDTIEKVDHLWSQAARGTIANCDPTLRIASDAEFPSIQKGSGKALQVEKGGEIGYLELDGTASEAATKLAEKLEDRAALVARCELRTNFDGPAKTEEEVEKNYSNMIEQADELREQYGERGVKRLMEMVLRAARGVDRTYIDWDSNPEVPTLTRSKIKLPKKRVQDDLGKVTWVERELGNGEQIELTWPAYFTPSMESIMAAVTAAGSAKQYSMIAPETATKFIAEHFQIEDVKGEVEKAKTAQQEVELQSAMNAGAMFDAGPGAGGGAAGAGGPNEAPPKPGAIPLPAPRKQLTA